MTISTTTRKAGPYAGNGVATSFAFAFKIFQRSDLRVVLTNADDIESTLILNSDYSVTLNSDQDVSPGGSVTYPLSGSPLAIGSRLTLVSNVPELQQTDITNGSGFYPSTIENALDNSVILIQQNAEVLGRALFVPVSTPNTVSTALPFPAANNVIGWNENADALQNFDPNLFASVVSYGSAVRDLFTGDGATTVYTLSSNPGASANLDIDIQGVTQAGGIDFLWTGGTTVTFTTAPPAGMRIQIRYMQGLPQGSITQENVTGITDPSTSLLITIQQYITKLFSSIGSTLVGFIQAGTGSVLRTVQAKLRQIEVNVDDFGGANDTAIFQAAVNSGAKVVKYSRNMTFTAAVTLPSNIIVRGDGQSVITWVSGSFNAFTATGQSNIRLVDVVGASSTDSVSKPFISVVACTDVHVHRCRSTNGLLFRSDSGQSYAASNDTNYCRDIRVTQCQYQGTRSIPGAFGAITLFYTIGALVQDNVLNGCPGGLQWWGGDSNDTTGQGAIANERKCRDIVVTGNKVNGCEAGLWGSMGDGVVVVGNRVTDCTDVGIDFEGTWNFTCSGNTVDGCKFACISSFFSSKNGEISGNQIKVTNLNPGGPRYGIWFTGLSTSIVRNINIDANNIVSELGASTVADLFFNDATLFCVNINIRNNTFVDGRAVIRRMNNPVFEGNKIYWPTVTANGNGIFADGNRQHRFDNNTFLRDNADSSPATDQAAIYLSYVDATYNNEQYSCSGNRIAGWNTYAIYDQFAGAGQSFAAIVGNGVSGGIFRTGSAGVFKGLVSGNYSFGNPSIPVTATTY